MKKNQFIQTVCLISGIACLAACTSQKPEPAPTQIIDGRLITIPPEFDVLPDPALIQEQLASEQANEPIN